MNWDMLGAVGEIISAIAVVASLIYLARQIQHTRRAYVVESVEVAAMKTIDFATAIAADSDLADLMMRVQAEG